MEGLTKDLECLHCNDFYECKGKPKDTGICIKYNQRKDYEAPKSEQVVFKPKRKPITQLIEEVAENICDNFCKYRDTCDEDCECEWIRQGNQCPLAKLY